MICTPVAFNDIDEFVGSCITTKGNIGTWNAILATNGRDCLFIQMGHCAAFADVDAAFVLFLEEDVRRTLVEADSESFNFVLNRNNILTKSRESLATDYLNNPLMRHWLSGIKNDQD